MELTQNCCTVEGFGISGVEPLGLLAVGWIFWKEAVRMKGGWN
jgi:hypothetical protein